MGDFKLLDQLTTEYTESANKSVDGDWVNYIKAHGLANSCVIHCPLSERPQRLEQVYKIEESWYKGKHPQKSPKNHQKLINQHKQLLKTYRENTGRDLDRLQPAESALGIDEIFSDANLSQAENFSHDVFSMSESCTDGFVSVCRTIIESSIEILGGSAPCGLAVVGLGSVARGEATPYSDLEYAFIVESDNHMEYFTRLAVDSYFRINNLGETPLHSFNIQQLNEKEKRGEPLFKDHVEDAGLRIDGITEWSGNIPTGNGLPNGKKLIRTVGGFMEFYQSELMSPPAELADFSDFLSTLVLIYSNEKGAKLYQEFLSARLEYERKVAVYDADVRQKRLNTLMDDIEKYDFLPDFNPHIGFMRSNTNIQVKADIFRYPTLLATNLRISLILSSRTPWDTYSELCRLGILSVESLRYMHIILALSIYVRTRAYIILGTQSVLLSLYTRVIYTLRDKKERYHVPQNLFVTLGCLLIPVKKAFQSFISAGRRKTTADRTDMRDFMRFLVKDFHVSKTDFMLTAEVLFFAGDHKTAVAHLQQAVGEVAVTSCVRFIEVIRREYSTTKADIEEKKYVRLCCNIMYANERYEVAIDYLQWLILYESGASMYIVSFKLWLGDCMNRTKSYKEAKPLLDQCILMIKQELGISVETPLPAYIFSQLGSGRLLTDRTIDIFDMTVSVFGTLGSTLAELQHSDQAVKCLQVAVLILEQLIVVVKRQSEKLDPKLTEKQKKNRKANTAREQRDRQQKILALTNTAGAIYCVMTRYLESLAFYKKALDMRKEIYGEHTNHSDIAASYYNMAIVFNELGGYDGALKFNTGALRMYEVIFGPQADNPNIANCYNNIGSAYYLLGEYTLALQFHTVALNIRSAIHGGSENKPDIATSYNNIGNVHLDTGNYSSAKECLTKALSIRRFLHGESSNRDTATSLNSLGWLYTKLHDYANSLKHLTAAVNMRIAVYKTTPNHPDIADGYNNIGNVYLTIGEYTKALEYYTKTLNMHKATYVLQSNNPSIADCYNNIGQVNFNLGQYVESLKNHTVCLKMRKAVCGENSHHPVIMGSYKNIADLYLQAGRCSEALIYYNKVLIMCSRCEDAIIEMHKIGETLIELSDYKRAYQILKKGFKQIDEYSIEDPDFNATTHYMMGKCCMELKLWRKSWYHLHIALCICQSLPTSTKMSSYRLARVHLIIGLLLVHLEDIPQSLEHSQRALKLSTDLLVDKENITPGYIRVNKEATTLVESLILIKVCQTYFG